MIIENAIDYKDCFKENDIYVFTIGYEHRSYFLLDYLLEHYPSARKLILVLNDHFNYPHVVEKIKQLEEMKIDFQVVDYLDSISVNEKVQNEVSAAIEQDMAVTIHIDYSSMPRSWYCNLPITLKQIIRADDRVFFWYSEGKYPETHEEYPSAGIDSFSLFAGKPSLQIDNNRIHVIALGYDVIRTQAILSITDPGYFVACLAYDPHREGFLESLKEANNPILGRSAMTIALHLNDFEFMVSKMCETANELLPSGDIILIPDGPKPLIFAMSLVPLMIEKNGITCLHITRNKDHFEAVDVYATGVVCGFIIKKRQ